MINHIKKNLIKNFHSTTFGSPNLFIARKLHNIVFKIYYFFKSYVSNLPYILCIYALKQSKINYVSPELKNINKI